jgi:hypothetical protein
MNESKNKTEKMKREILDILRSVHVHGVDGDFDGCDRLDKDPHSMSIQTATKKIAHIITQIIKSRDGENKFEKIRDLLEYQTDEVDIRLAQESSVEVAVFNPITGKNWKDDRVQEYQAFNDTDEALSYVLSTLSKEEND